MRPGPLVAQDLFGPTNEAFAASDTDSCLERQTPFAPNHIGESDADASVLFVPKGKASLKEYDVSLPLTICHTLEPCHNGPSPLYDTRKVPYPEMGSRSEASTLLHLAVLDHFVRELSLALHHLDG